MDNLKNIQDFITEKRVTVKRRYTEKHPAKNVSTAARVRSAILDAVADGHLTEDEVNNILSEIKASELKIGVIIETWGSTLLFLICFFITSKDIY